MAMPPSLNDLSQVAGRLETAFASTEERFLHIGGSLGTAIEILGRVNAAFETLRLELESPDVHLATRQIGEAARQVSALAVTLTGERGTFDRLMAASLGIAARIERLRKTVGAVKVLAINARIEAAHINDPNVDFSVFTREIGRLAVLAEASLDRFSGELGKLDQLLHAASTGQTEFEENHKATLLAVAQRLNVSLRSVTNHRQQAATAALAIFETSRQVVQRIGEAVTALQIGDITRQRIEHVAHALGVLVRSLTPGAGGEARPDLCHSLDDDQRQLLIATVCRLQSAQLTHAIQDFDREVRRIVAALQGMAGDARKILKVGKESYGASDSQGVSFLLKLEGELGQADSLIKGYREARTEVDRVAGSVSTAVAELFRHVEAVHNIEADMRIVGLNTALKCGRLGDQGRALSIIAQELRNDANRTVEEAAPIMAGLQEIVAVSGALSGGSREDKAAEATALTEAMAASVGRLGATDRCLTSALGSLERDSERVAALLDDTSARITLHEEVCRVLRDLAARLDSIAGETKGDNAAMARIKDRVLSLVKGRYTMESEREIHALFAEAGSGADRPAAAMAPARKAEAAREPAIDDFLL